MSSNKSKELVHITDTAAEKIVALLRSKEKCEGIRIRVLNNRGCYGKKYNVEYVKEGGSDEFDEVVMKIIGTNTVKVFIDRKTVFSIFGTIIDYVEEKMMSGFVFNNPREKGRCGCGKSFH